MVPQPLMLLASGNLYIGIQHYILLPIRGLTHVILSHSSFDIRLEKQSVLQKTLGQGLKHHVLVLYQYYDMKALIVYTYAHIAKRSKLNLL